MPEPERSVAEVMADREPNGRFVQGDRAAVKHGPPRQLSRKLVRSMLLEALAGEQLRTLPPDRHKKGRKGGKQVQLVRAAAINDIILGLRGSPSSRSTGRLTDGGPGQMPARPASHRWCKS